jgi:hypothetical protein
VRTGYVLTAALLAATAAPVAAAPKKAPHSSNVVCNLIVSPRSAVRAAPSLDILSGDVATGKHTLVAVLRVDTGSPDPATVAGGQWDFGFTIQGVAYGLHYANGTGSLRGGDGTQPARVKATFTPGLVTWVVDRSAFPGLRRPKAVLTRIYGTTGTTVGTVDSATTQRPYVDRTPSCVHAD